MKKALLTLALLITLSGALLAMTDTELRTAYKLLNTNSYEALDDYLNGVKDKDASYYKLRSLAVLMGRNKDSVAIYNRCREKLLADYPKDLSIYPYIFIVDLMNGSIENLKETVGKLREQRPDEGEDNTVLCYYILTHLREIPGITVSEDDINEINAILGTNSVFTIYGNGIKYKEGMKGIGILAAAMEQPYDESFMAKLNKNNLAQKDFMFANLIAGHIPNGQDAVRVYMKLADIYPDNALIAMGLKEAIIDVIEEEYLYSREEKSLGAFYKDLIEKVDKSIKSHPDMKELKNVKGGFLFLAGRYEECIALCREIESKNPYAYLFIYLSATHSNNRSMVNVYLDKLDKLYGAAVKTDKKAYRCLFQLTAIRALLDKNVDRAANHAVRCVNLWGTNDLDNLDQFIDYMESGLRGYKNDYDVYNEKAAGIRCLLALDKILAGVGRTLDYLDYMEIAGSCYETLNASEVTTIGNKMKISHGKTFKGDVNTAIFYYQKAIGVLSASEFGNKDELINIIATHIQELRKGEVMNGVTTYEFK